MKGTLEPSVSSWQKERDGMLDTISYLKDRTERASAYIMELCKIHNSDVQFDLSEALLILNETRIDSDARRFGEITDGLVESDPTQKEVTV